MLISTHHSGTPRPLNRFRYLLERIQKNLYIVQKRHMDIVKHTGGPIAFLSDLLLYIQDPGVLKKDMLDVQTGIVQEELDSIVRVFDIVESGVRHKTDTFIKGHTKEIYIPTTGILGTKVTALDDWSVWKNIQPIKLVAHNSNELKLYWYDQIVFTKDKPTYAVFAIDIEALLLKYFVYLREMELSLDNTELHSFINFEIMPFMYVDLVDIWVQRMLSNISDTEEPSKFITGDLNFSSVFTNAMEELTEFYKDLIRGQYRIGDLLKTKLFLDNRSLLDIVYLQEEVFCTSLDLRHSGYGLLKMADLLNLVTNVLLKTRERGLETATIRKLQYDARSLSRSSWDSHMKEPSMIMEVSSIITKIEALSL